MAKETSRRDNTNVGASVETVDIQINEDDITEVAGANRKRDDAVEEEKLVKWQLPGQQDISSAKKTLIHLLTTLIMTHTSDITIIDSKQREWSFKGTGDEDRFSKEMEKIAINLHPIKNKKENSVIRWVSITKIRSVTKISEWKDNDLFYDEVQEAKTYLFPHPFGYTEWDIISIGFIKDFHAVHYPRDLLQDQILQLIKKQEKEPPTFQLVSQRITNNEKNASTKAFVMQCQKKDAEKLTHLMTHGPFRDPANQKFVPFRYKRTKPEVFLKCIRQQNDVYFKTWIIKVEGISTEAMQYIGSDIMSIRGVLHVVPSKRINEIGEWKILTDRSKCNSVHKQLAVKWPNLMQLIPVKLVQEAPSSYPSPTISSKRARDYQDDDSADDSYGSLLTTGTEISVLTNDDMSLNNLPVDFQYNSYAEVASGTSITVEETQISSPSASAYAEWITEKQALMKQINNQAHLIENQAQQLEKIQADLLSKISRSKDLEDQLALALETAQVRELKFDEMMEKFDMMMNHQTQTLLRTSQNHYDHAMQYLPSTPDRPLNTEGEAIERPQAGPSPPTKKHNNNSSPHRNIYALFRQPSSKSTSTKPKSTSRQQVARNLYTEEANHMETDDDGRQPAPGAQPGDKMTS